MNKDKSKSMKGRKWRLTKKKMKDSPHNHDKEIYDIKELLEARQINLKPRVNVSKVSKLSPTLLDILKKSVALGYFLDFLKKSEQKCLLEFWLEAETFRMISERKYRRRNSKALRESPYVNTLRRSSTSTSSIISDKPDSNNLDDSLNSSFDSNTDVRSCDSMPPSSTDRCYGNQNTDTNNDQKPFTNDFNNMRLTNHEWNAGDEPCEDLTNRQKVFASKKASTLPKTTTPSTSIDHFRQRARTRSAVIDAVSIYTKYLSLNADCPIHLPSPQRQQIEGIICRDKTSIDPDCFVIAQDFVFQQLTCLHGDFLLTNFMISYQLKFLEDKQINLNDILYDEAVFFYFMEFLDQRGVKAILEFYMSAENFQEDKELKILNAQYETEEAVNDAMHIYERYFSLKCEPQLISDDKLRIVLENNICREDGPQPSCFCIHMAYAWTALSEVYLPAFLVSDLFSGYLDHLRRSLNSPKQHQHEKRPQPDDKSLSSRSSLLDEDEFALVKTDSKMNLFDDKAIDEFWFKPSHHQQKTNRLTLGHVNEFGVFNSHMEPQPISKSDSDSSVSKFGKAMKNLIRGEIPEETEQFAWERARKIIADIQKQTQS